MQMYVDKENGESDGDSAITVAIVTHHPDPQWLDRTFQSLATALGTALKAGTISEADIVVIDNATNEPTTPQLAALRSACNGVTHVRTHALAGHGNVGFGRGNNLAFARYGDHEFFLVLNPDVVLDLDAIRIGVEYLQRNRHATLVTPAATGADGMPQFLAKRAPSVAALALRGFAPAFLRRWFARYLAAYEYRAAGDPAFNESLQNVPIASGCFMLMRGSAFREADGFDPSFFLYFEDFDLSVRLKKCGELVRVNGCNIVHVGGNAARKGLRHQRLFIRSAVRFFNKHGWKLW
jgi:GT2 family glycosyltransferase